MKLQTWITWLCCLSVLITTLLVDALIWTAERRNFINEFQTDALNDAYELFNEYTRKIYSGSGIEGEDQITDNRLQYFFKVRQEDYAVCVRVPKPENANSVMPDDRENAYCVYNHTIFTTDDLLPLDYTLYSDGQTAYADDLTYEGSHYLVYRYRYNVYSTLSVYYIKSLEPVWQKLRNLTVYMIFITIGVLCLMAVVVTLMMRRSLRPLRELNETASDIAKGNYEKRVAVKGKNEISELADNFNRMAEAVESHAHSLMDSEQKKTLFMGNLTHELKTPLAAISGYAQTLLAVKLSEEEQADALLYINDECRRLERLSRKMMRLLELDAETEIDLREVTARRLFEQTALICDKTLSDKGTTLCTDEHGESFCVDEDLMTEVLVNLVDNANKASKPGDVITLSASDGMIVVSDNGCGIPKEEQEKILEPFYMIDKSRSRKSGGAGLGLALTAAILRQHHMRLEIQSEVGVGTRMILHFV